MGIGTCIIAKPWSRVIIEDKDPKLQEKSIDIVKSGFYEITPDLSYDGLSKVKINVSTLEYVQASSLTDLPTTGINEGTIGVVYNNIVPFYPGINTNKLMFDTTKSFREICNNIFYNNLFESSGTLIQVALGTSGKTIEDFISGSDIMVPSKFLFLYPINGSEIFVFNNTTSSQFVLEESVDKIFSDGNWIYTAPIESETYFSLDTFYILKITGENDAELLFTQTVDDFLNLKETMTCQVADNELIDTYKFIDGNWMKQNKV